MIGVCIVTYNQEKYIAQAIESVLIQADCGHKVVAYIGEDCSKDRTGKVCDEIASQVNAGLWKVEGDKGLKVIHNPQNLGLVGNTMNLLNIMRHDGCSYIAMLDGDDFWTDPKKLQKQMSYFEQHPELGLVHTCVDTQYPGKLVLDKRISVQEGDVSAIVFGYKIANCSVMFKSELLNRIDFDEFQQQGLMSCDFMMYVIFSCYTNFGFLPDHTAIWRRGHDSVSNTNDLEKQINYVNNDIAAWRYAAKLFPERWHATKQEVEDYAHYRAFCLAFHYRNSKRALLEVPYLNPEDKKKSRFKIWFVRLGGLLILRVFSL